MKSLVAKDPSPANEIGARKPRLERRTEALSRATLLALSPVPSTHGECNRLEDTGNEKTSETGENLSRFIPFSAACEPLEEMESDERAIRDSSSRWCGRRRRLLDRSGGPCRRVHLRCPLPG